jgi:NADH-quinone oxidoreductase subunit F
MTDTILTTRMVAHPADSHTIDRYLATGGYDALRKAVNEMTPEEVVGEVKASNMRGRGGAGFPTGVKWGFLPDTYPRYLVVNCDESEPGTFNDRQLTFVYIRGEYAKGARRLQNAIDEATAAGYLGENILGSDFSLTVTIHLGGGAYICGEETALLNSLEGRRGEPRLKPPFPAIEGLYAKPTIVNNVESISNIPWITLNGGNAYASIGPERSAGTKMLSISGHINQPGNYEIVMGMTWRELIYEVGGGIPGDRELKAWIPGGASAPWFIPSLHLDTLVTFDDVGQNGSMIGAGAVVVMDETTDVVAAAHSIVRFFAHESCGQCTPCREGTSWLQAVLERIMSGGGRLEDIDLLLDVSDNISPGLKWPPAMTTICPLGPSATAPVSSIIKYFRDEVETMIGTSEVANV